MSSKRVVIIGGGPSGLAAAVGLARAGCSVQVFERREHPDKISSDAEDRAFVVALNLRGRAALEQAGFDLAAFERPNSGVVPYGSVQRMTTGLFNNKKSQGMRIAYPALLGDRMSWVRLMLEQVEGWGLNITFTFNAACEALDLQGRTVAIRQGDGPAQVVPFDLLVGADGAYSQVRTCLAQALPPGQLSVKIEPSPRLYKVIRGLPADEFGDSKQVNMFLPTSPGIGPYRGAFVMVVPRYDDGKRCGTLRMLSEAWEGLSTADDYAALLTTRFPCFPAACVPQVAAQLAANETHVAGTRVATSQFHGPGVVLIGDAAHAVLPMTGQGFNSALQDAVLLAQLLESHDGDLAAVPPAFTDIRKPETDALGWLDRQGHIRSASDCSPWHPVYLLACAERAARSVLGALTRGAVYPASSSPLYMTPMPYSKVKRRILAEDVAAVGAILGAASAAALWLVAHARPEATGRC